MAKTKRFNQIPTITDLTDAKIVGLDKDGKDASFDLANIVRSERGIATPAGSPTGARFTGETWLIATANYGSTFTNFGNITVPAKVGDKYVYHARFVWNAGAWTLQYELVDGPVMTDYLVLSANNELNDDESTFSGTSTGRWAHRFSTPTFAIVNGKLRITFNSGINQGIGISGLLKAGVKFKGALKIKLISGTAKPLSIGFFASTPSSATLQFTPTTSEVEYSGDIVSTTDADFVIGFAAANNTGQVIEIDDVYLNKYVQLAEYTDSRIGSIIGTNMLDSDTQNMNGTGGKWAVQLGAMTKSFANSIMSLMFTTMAQSVYIPNLLSIGITYNVKLRIRRASGAITNLVVGEFASVPTVGRKEITLTDSFVEHTFSIKATVSYFSIGVVQANNLGGVVEVDYVTIQQQGVLDDMFSKYVPKTTANKSTFYNTSGVWASLSKNDKACTKIVILADSLKANMLGGTIPPNLDEGNNNRPYRLTYNNFARRLYDELSWNKPTFRRLSSPDWTKVGSWSVANSITMFEPIYDNESMFENIVANSSVEIRVPAGQENFAFFYQEYAGFASMTVTLNGGSIATYGPSNLNANVSGLGHTGNPYALAQYTGLPAGENTIKITRDNTTAICRIWGGFYWSGNTMIVINASHGGHTLADLLNDHIDAEVVRNKPDAIYFQLTLMNDAARSTPESSSAALKSILDNKLAGKDILITSTYPYGTDPVDGTPNYFLTYPGFEEMKNTLKEVVISGYQLPFVDLTEVFKRKIQNRGGTLAGGEGGLWYTHDGQHANLLGVEEEFNIVKPIVTNNPLKNG